MTDTISIPLNKLLAWEGNVRKTNPDKAIDELAASIYAHGLLQSLVVRKDKRGKYAVVAGRRRLLALESLVESGSMKAQTLIPCHVLDDEADATEISLAENVQREAMHPADEFEAFRALIDKGTPAADVAARFGVTETVVKRRLKLANVSPKLIAAYRNGEMTLQHVMAFAVTDDHEAQERVWGELADCGTDPDDIRSVLTEQEITATDRRVRFVTLQAYEKAGGTVRRDLFSDGENGVFIDDVVLLETLVARKLEKTAQKLRKEGWKWVQTVPAFVYADWMDFERCNSETLPLSPKEQQEFDTLRAEFEALEQIEEPTDEQQARSEAIGARLDELEDRPEVWPPETLAIAGAVVTLGSHGEPDIRYGYIKPEDAPETSSDDTDDLEHGTDASATERPALSALLVESLTSHRSAALNAALLERPDVALAAVTHVMALQIFYNAHSDDTCLQIDASDSHLEHVEGSPAHALIEAARQHWVSQMPGEPDGLFAWCRSQNGDTLRGLLTFCVAQTINAVMLKADRPDCDRLAHAAQLADALSLDMGAWFKPTAANYFGRIGKAKILETLREVKGATAPAWEKLKKTDLAVLAERELSAQNWLPEPLRTVLPASETALEAA
jgi:ParB family transcriptional regulator, chromosome partitioning protein